MEIVFVHKEYPGQYGHVAHALAERHGHRCTFVYTRMADRHQQAIIEGRPVRLPLGGLEPSAGPLARATTGPGGDPVYRGVRLIPYRARGASVQTHPCGVHFEISMWNNQAVLEAMQSRRDIRPDLIVGHSFFGNALFLADHYRCPLLAYCEYFYRPRDSDLDFRPEFPPTAEDGRLHRTYNATTLLNLDVSAAGLSPTEWQRSTFPVEYQPKIRTIFDGVDRTFWYHRGPLRAIAGRPIPPKARVVTYVSYGFEPTRGFDIFMQVTARICEVRDDVIFVVVGADRSYYGRTRSGASPPSFREQVLARGHYDLDRFLFTGQVLEDDLARILSRSDLHIYLTVPFVLSWSLMDAMACGCTVLASATAPVLEIIQHGENGLLAGFDDVDGLAEEALRVLDDPEAFRHLGHAATQMIDERYSVESVLPQIEALYANVARSG